MTLTPLAGLPAAVALGDVSRAHDGTVNSPAAAAATYQVVSQVNAVGTYGSFTANGNADFILGVAGATTPAVYNLQSLALNDSGALTVVSPVIINLAGGVILNGNVGDSGH
jgi:hypothetical protein